MQELDVRGRFCPIPLFETKCKIEELSPGDILEVIADDETVKETIPRWCKMHNYPILSMKEVDDYFIITIQKR